jgi:hypothetical protein
MLTIILPIASVLVGTIRSQVRFHEKCSIAELGATLILNEVRPDSHPRLKYIRLMPRSHVSNITTVRLISYLSVSVGPSESMDPVTGRYCAVGSFSAASTS